MRVPSPYKCDYCENLKGETNHWWLRSSNPIDTDIFSLCAWDDGSASENGVEHICSEACATKALSKWMGEQK